MQIFVIQYQSRSATLKIEASIRPLRIDYALQQSGETSICEGNPL
jgi:hypothetical protein